MKAFVAGATGETGRRIVRQLADRGYLLKPWCEIYQWPDRKLPEQVDLVTADLSNPTALTAAMAGCTVILSATGARPSLDPGGPYQVDYQGTKHLVDAARATGIQHFVMVSSLCVSK
jgi:nucleoside-diphosphate-sugar epimerase